MKLGTAQDYLNLWWTMHKIYEKWYWFLNIYSGTYLFDDPHMDCTVFIYLKEEEEKEEKAEEEISLSHLSEIDIWWKVIKYKNENVR